MQMTWIWSKLQKITFNRFFTDETSIERVFLAHECDKREMENDSAQERIVF